MSDSENKVFEFAEFVFDTRVNTLSRSGSIVSLEPVSSRVLNYLLTNHGRLIPKEEILEAVWPDVFTTDDVLKRAVSQIRRALGDDARNSRFLETHHRRGYRFIMPSADCEDPTGNSRNGQSISSGEFSDRPRFDCFTGRSRELESLKSELASVKAGRGRPVLIFGEPGIGKTQIAAQFSEWAAKYENVVSLRVRFFDYEASFLPAFDVFLDLLGDAIGAVLGAKADNLRQTVADEIGVDLPSELFSNASTEGRFSGDTLRAIIPIAECFVRLSRRRPILLIFDDLQWADPTSRQIIGHLMRVSADTPLMILGLTRRGELEDPQSELAIWLQSQATYRSFTMLELSQLSAEDYRVLIEEVFAGRLETSRISQNDLGKLHEATGGNPYFLVETLRLLMNAGVITRTGDDGNWRWDGLRDVPLPETVRMAARAKLGSISASTRDLVECAAVLGDAFLVDTLAHMIDDDGLHTADALDRALDEAIAAQILTEHNVGGADDCQFYHTTIRRAVFLDLSPRRRKRLHARAVKAIELSHASDLERFSAALAAHAENAGDFARSLELNLRACRAAAARFDWLEAAELMDRAERVAALGQIPESAEFLAIRGEVLMSVGRRTEAETLLARAAEIEESPEILHNLGRTRILLGRYRQSIEPLERALELATEKSDSSGRAAALIQFASAKYALCEYDESCAILQGIVDSHSRDSYHRAVALGKLGWTRALQSRYREARILLREALRFHESAGDMRERAVLAMCLSWCEHGNGEYETAIAYAQQARREAEIVGEPYNESVALMRIAKARIAQSFSADVIDDLTAVAQRQEDLNAPHALAETIWMRGRARLDVGEFEAAGADLEKSLSMIREIGDRDDEFRILIDLADLNLRLDLVEKALELSVEAAEIAGEIGVVEGIGEALVVQSRARFKLGQVEPAVAAARESVRRLQDSESGELWRAFSILAEILMSGANDSDELESCLRLAVEQLDAMRTQFSAEDDIRRARFTANRGHIAADLCAVLRRRGKAREAEVIAKQWRLD